jgi:CHAT domain-containing protein/tetratricopeptide (TPR) repeat protein
VGLWLPLAARGQDARAQFDAAQRQLFELGNQAQAQRDFRKAVGIWQRGLQRSEAAGDAHGMGMFLSGLVRGYGDLGQIDQAIRCADQGIGIMLRLNEPANAARTAWNLGVVCFQAGRYEKSLAACRQSALIWEKVGDPEPFAEAVNGMGNALNRLGRLSDALEAHQRALGIYETLKKPNGVATSLNGIALVQSGLGQLEEAAALMSRALALHSNPEDQGIGLSNLASVYGKLGLYEQALQASQKALAVADGLNNPKSAASALINGGIANLGLGQYFPAIAAARRALTLGRELQQPDLMANALNNLGVAYHRMGQAKRATECWEQAIALDAEQPGLSSAATARANLYQRQDDPRDVKALSALTSAPDAEKQPRRLAEWLVLLGEAHQRLRQPAPAIAAFQRAIGVLGARVDRTWRPRALAGLANSQLDAGRHQEALASFDRALEFWKDRANDTELAALHAGIGRTREAMGDLPAAVSSLSLAIQLVEKSSRQVDDASQVGAFQARHQKGIYAQLAGVLLRQGKPNEALLTVERGRAQGLARQAAMNRGDLSGILPKEEAARLGRVSGEFDLAARALRAAENVGSVGDAASDGLVRRHLSAMQGRLQRAEIALTSLRGGLIERFPAFRRLYGAEAPRLQELEALAGRHKDTLFLEWAVGASANTLLFVLSADEGVRAFSLPSDERVLREAAAAWRGALSEHGGAPGTEARQAQNLYNLVLGEVEKAGLLAPGRYRRLVVAPDGPLQKLPFGALLDPRGARIADRFPVSSSLSLTALVWPAEPSQARGPLLIAADPTSTPAAAEIAPPLAAARAEGRAISALFPGSTLLVGEEASENAVESQLAAYRILHFATHGLLDEQDGLRSALVLAANPRSGEDVGLLEAGEIATMRLGATLAVLSACDTGQGEASAGDGLLGLTWAFRAAGCPSVVASLWSVDGQATGALMVAFYRGLKEGKPKDEALRSAVLQVRGTPRWQHPYYWAAFQLQGDWSPLAL